MDSAKSTFASERKERTRAALRLAMLQLLVEKPFDEIQILDLTGRAKVGYATFFRHYASTKAVLDEIASDEIRELFAMTLPVLQQSDTQTTLRALCQYVSERQNLWRTLLTGGAAHSVRNEFVRQAQDWARQTENPNKTPVPIDMGTICVAGSTLDALAWWLDQGGAYGVEEMAGFIDRLIISPFIDAN